MKNKRSILSGLLAIVLVVALLVLLPKVFGGHDDVESDDPSDVAVQADEAFDASFESREDYIGYINQLPPYDPYVKEPAADVEKIAEIFQDEFTESAQTQMVRNPSTKEYFVRSLGEDPTDRAITPDTYHVLDDSSLIYFSQWDQRWAFKHYNENDIAITACGPSTLALLYANMSGDSSVTPDKMAAFAEENGYNVEGHGTSWDFMTEGAASFGMQAEVLPLDEATMKNTLNEGRPIIAILGPGEYFTTGGHFIMLWAVEDDKFQVVDVFDIHNSNRLWEFDEFAGQVQNLWAYTYQG